MTVGGEDEDRMIKMSPYTDWVLRHSAFNGQIEDSELTEENETEQQKETTRLVGWMDSTGRGRSPFCLCPSEVEQDED